MIGGIVLSHEDSPTEVHFLDLKISIQNGSIVTSTFIKQTEMVFSVGFLPSPVKVIGSA